MNPLGSYLNFACVLGKKSLSVSGSLFSAVVAQHSCLRGPWKIEILWPPLWGFVLGGFGMKLAVFPSVISEDFWFCFKREAGALCVLWKIGLSLVAAQGTKYLCVSLLCQRRDFKRLSTSL